MSFLVREFEGKRAMILGARRELLLVIPALMAGWWGSGKVRPFAISGMVLMAIWFALGKEAGKAGRKIEELRGE